MSRVAYDRTNKTFVSANSRFCSQNERNAEEKKIAPSKNCPRLGANKSHQLQQEAMEDSAISEG
jgi:hypothetical protein